MMLLLSPDALPMNSLISRSIAASVTRSSSLRSSRFGCSGSSSGNSEKYRCPSSMRGPPQASCSPTRTPNQFPGVNQPESGSARIRLQPRPGPGAGVSPRPRRESAFRPRRMLLGWRGPGRNSHDPESPCRRRDGGSAHAWCRFWRRFGGRDQGDRRRWHRTGGDRAGQPNSSGPAATSSSSPSSRGPWCSAKSTRARASTSRSPSPT